MKPFANQQNQPAIGIQGDVKDLCTMIKWTRRFWSRADSFTWTWDFRYAVCKASKDLCRCFEDAEFEHRRVHMQTEVDYDEYQSEDQEVSPTFAFLERSPDQP
jgi:hypothetical protein